MLTINLQKLINLFALSLIFVSIICAAGCAQSKASRGAASDFDQAYLEADYAVKNIGSTGLSGVVQNTSQVTKGVILGGALGAAAGSVTSGVGGAAGFGLGAIFGGAIGKYIDSHTTLEDQITNRQARVIILGDQIMIVVNSSQLFFENTSNLRSESFELLSKISEYINQYPNISVKVAAYTSAVEPETITKRLTQQQADNIVRYLWNSKLDTRLLYAEGAGGSKLVTANNNNWSSDNYRVEITLEKLPV